jgi:alkyl sulfatase BDS1-like metallo-beta-lactamase superfamily hydrolase
MRADAATAAAALAIASLVGIAALAASPPLAAQDRASGSGAATSFTRQANARVAGELPFADRQDFELATRGFIATRAEPRIETADGRVVWDLAAYDAIAGAAPDTVNPSLWRQAQLLAKHGLFKVADRVHQVRGFDISNVTFITGSTGYIVIDPLLSVETAAAAYELVRQQLGDRPVVAVIYTHSHADHFGGVRGVVKQEDVAAGKVKIIAPPRFLEESVAENVIAGNAMSRRAAYQFGSALPVGATGHVSSGLGQGTSRGTVSLIAPTDTIAATGETRTIDGVRLVFQLTPGTEAPAEMNVYFPEWKALCMAENAGASMHNILTPRGALVRDAKAWADYLTESITLYGGATDVVFASHFWPRWGGDAVRDYLENHRDAYKYLHDQGVRLLNQGYTGSEIAERLRLPDALARHWYNRGYYGTMSHNSKAVYQRYMGWYDGNPSHLHALPPEEAGRRYVEAMGGAAAVLERAHAAYDAGEYRWAAELADRLVFAGEATGAAESMLAQCFEQMGYQAEAGTWRDMYLTGARELRSGVPPPQAAGVRIDVLRNTPSSMLLDFLAVRLDGERAARERPTTIDLAFPDFGETHRVRLRNGVLIHEARSAAAEVAPAPPSARPDAVLTMSRAVFLQVAFAGTPLRPQIESGAVKVEGDGAAFEKLLGLLDTFTPDFAIVTP